MKKTLFIAAVAMIFATANVLAQDPVKTDSMPVPTERPAVEQYPQKQTEEFKAIEVEELPGAVIEVLKKDYPEGSIKELFVAEREAGKLYKVVILKNRTDASSEETILFNEKGEKVL